MFSMKILRRRRSPDASRGQALVEFALVLPILVLILLGIMQFGLLFWTQITLTQVARDTGRWAATQTACVQGTGANQADVVGEGKAIAGQSALFGFGGPADADLVVTPTWSTGTPCPPLNNATAEWVFVKMAYRVDVFLPLAADTCSPVCQRTLTTDVQFRMEPEPAS
jgi:Flp pilus assembly protein TadG